MGDLRWVHLNVSAPKDTDSSASAYSRLVDGVLGTKYILYCHKHWDTGAPDEWIITKGVDKTIFPSQSEAKSYAEATYTLEEASHGD